jgi:hypothetical protein
MKMGFLRFGCKRIYHPVYKILAGNLPRKQQHLVQAWIELHHDELMADWELAVNGEEPYKITPQRGLVCIGMQKLPNHYLIIAFMLKLLTCN